MMNVWMWVILVLLMPLAVCWGLWLVFALLSLLPAARLRGRGGDAAKTVIDVLIPAHNERVLLPGLLKTLQEQTEFGRERLGVVLVIADHCSDETAAIARAAGVKVLERASGPRGKPAALRDGLVLLGKLTGGKGERAVGIVDADCTVTSNFVEELARAFDAGYKVAQVADVVDQPNARYSLSTIAFSLKNLIRPKGMARVGIPTQLFGTGMCFHSTLLAAGGPIQFSDHLTEDLAVSHDLLLRKIPPVFLPSATVRSPIPEDNKSMSTQKIRWETGQVHTWKKLPGLLLRLMGKGQLRSAMALLDWSAPPVAMAVLAWGFVFGLAVIFVLAGMATWHLLLAPVGVLAILVAYIVLGTLQLEGVGGVVHLVLSIPKFFVWKLALYTRMATGRGAKGWEKSRATPAATGSGAGSGEVRP
jgi:cellulose synthase/poly-beta-1,6-N-acetylglucosamine synthase-like glycosyltransferase